MKEYERVLHCNNNLQDKGNNGFIIFSIFYFRGSPDIEEQIDSNNLHTKTVDKARQMVRFLRYSSLLTLNISYDIPYFG